MHLYWKDMLLVVEVPPWVSPLCLLPKKNGIWVFLEVHDLNFLGPLKVNMDISYFYMNFFNFTEKFLPLFTTQTFFRNILLHYTTSIPNDIFYWFLWVDNRTTLIKSAAALPKKPTKRKSRCFECSSTPDILGNQRDTANYSGWVWT